MDHLKNMATQMASNALAGDHADKSDKNDKSDKSDKKSHHSESSGAGGIAGLASKFMGGHHSSSDDHGSGGHQGGLAGTLNSLAGGGKQAEHKEDALDKAIDLVQEKVLHQGPQDNESAIEQMKDKAIAEGIRHQYKSMTGHEFPIKPKN